MNARRRVAGARWALTATALVSSGLWALVVYALARSAMRLISICSDQGPHRDALRVFAMVLFVAALITALWRSRRAWSRDAVALWLEERAPALKYALVTVVEQPNALSAEELERSVEKIPFAPLIAKEIFRSVGLPFLVLVGAMALWFSIPRPRCVEAGEHPAGAGNGRPGVSAPSGLTPLTATVTPPGYSGLPLRTLEEPSSIPGLVASRVSVEGKGASAGIMVELNGASIPVVGDGARWHANFSMPAKATALALNDRAFHRLVILDPRPDSAPVVTLLSPAHDTVFRTPTGSLALAAEVRDDFGLADAWLEYIISSGEGESFTFRSGVLGRVNANNARTATVQGTLHLDELKLLPGDIVHIRAVARDLNNATGPDTGASDTRTLRIARKDEYDSVAVEGAPPPDADKSVLSERMLIMMAEDLQRRRPKLAREAVVSESQKIGRDQTRLRKEVSRIIFARLGAGTESEESNTDDDAQGKMTPDQLLAAADSATNQSAAALEGEGDETPVVALNRPLLEAYNAMWDASTRLNTGEPGDALPYMRAALAAIQRARAAERLYLRGRAPAAVVDLQKVRLAGKRDNAVAAVRSARSALDTTAARRVRRLSAALALLPGNRAAAIDSLQLLRLDAIVQDPAFAASLGPAIDSLRSGGNATLVLARARRAAAGAPVGAEERRELGGRTVTDFTFVTVRYESGDWDAAPLVPENIIDTIARYTSIKVEPAGVVVPLSSPDLMRYPVRVPHGPPAGAIQRGRARPAARVDRARRFPVRGRSQPRHRRRVPQDRDRGARAHCGPARGSAQRQPALPRLLQVRGRSARHEPRAERLGRQSGAQASAAPSCATVASACSTATRTTARSGATTPTTSASSRWTTRASP